MSLAPTDDAQVQGGKYRATNYGSASYLGIKEVSDASYVRKSFLRFDLSGLLVDSGTEATLRVYVSKGANTAFNVLEVADDAWSENSLTFDTAPPIGATIATGSTANGTWVDIDISAYVAQEAAGDGIVSLALEGGASYGQFRSKEHTQAPSLVLDAGVAEPEGEEPPTPEDPPTQQEPVCGDNSCTADESCSACPSDCGSCGSSSDDYLVISSQELAALPMSGSGWDRLRARAYGSWGTANIADQDNKHAVKTFAGALVYARTGDVSLRAKVRDAIAAAIGTEVGGRTLTLGRSLGAYVMAADLIRLTEYTPIGDQQFRAWLTDVRTQYIGNHGRWVDLTQTHEDTPNNWGTFAGASRLAASLYLGDTSDVNRVAQVFAGWLGDRASYDGFRPSAAYESSWACDPVAMVAVNPDCTLSGIDVDGVLVDDISRGGPLSQTPGSTGISYSWEAMQGVVLQAELLKRAGYSSPYLWSNQALLRACDYLFRDGRGLADQHNVSYYVTWMINASYGTSYPTGSAENGRVFAHADWLYGQ